MPGYRLGPVRRRSRWGAYNHHGRHVGPELAAYASCLRCRRLIALSAGKGYLLALAERDHIKGQFAELGMEWPRFPRQFPGRNHPGKQCKSGAQ